MLYLYKNKIYIKPMEYKFVEVKIDKKGEGYDINPVGSPIELSVEEMKNAIKVSLQEAFDKQNVKTSKSTKGGLGKFLD